MNTLEFRRQELAIEQKILKRVAFPKNAVQREIQNNSKNLIAMIKQEIKELENAKASRR